MLSISIRTLVTRLSTHILRRPANRPDPIARFTRTVGIALVCVLWAVPGCSKDGDAKGDENAGAPTDETLALIQSTRTAFADRSKTPKQPPFPQNPQLEALMSQGQFDAMVQILEPIVKAQPELGRPRMLLALAHHKSKRYAQARPHWEAVLKGGPAFDTASGAIYLYGWCLYYLGEPEHSREAFQAFLDVTGKEHDDAYFGMGLCDIELSELDRAQENLTTALQLIEQNIARDPRLARSLAHPFAKTHTRLGEVAMLKNDLEVARDHLIAAVNRMPPAYEAWFLLSRVYTRLGNDDLADHAKKQHDEWEEAARTGRKG